MKIEEPMENINEVELEIRTHEVSIRVMAILRAIAPLAREAMMGLTKDEFILLMEAVKHNIDTIGDPENIMNILQNAHKHIKSKNNFQ